MFTSVHYSLPNIGIEMTDKEYLQQIGKNIYDLRKRKKMTQTEVADLCGWEKTTINRIEKGRSNITALTVRKLAAAFGVKPERIFKGC